MRCYEVEREKMKLINIINLPDRHDLDTYHQPDRHDLNTYRGYILIDNEPLPCDHSLQHSGWEGHHADTRKKR